MTGKVAVITGGSQGIGAGLVTGYRGRGWAVVPSALAALTKGGQTAGH
jgi:NAD(P)-dependent dehydrogenase (short-subunit alcohol dehydrogenase family)